MLVSFKNQPLALCYANSILQVLFHHLSSATSSPTQSKPPPNSYPKGTIKARKRFESVSTSKLMRYVESQSAMPERERPHDCHEIYIWLMNEINDQWCT